MSWTPDQVAGDSADSPDQVDGHVPAPLPHVDAVASPVVPAVVAHEAAPEAAGDEAAPVIANAPAPDAPHQAAIGGSTEVSGEVTGEVTGAATGEQGVGSTGVVAVAASATVAVTHVLEPYANFERKLFVPPPPPKPKPIIVPERTDNGCRTAGVSIDRAAGRAVYIAIRPSQGPAQTIYVCSASLKTLSELAAAPAPEPGRLWKALCDIPIERPLPNRQLEDELRVLLAKFGHEFRS